MTDFLLACLALAILLAFVFRPVFPVPEIQPVSTPLDPVPRKDEVMAIPQGLLDALNTAQDALDAANTASDAKKAADASLASAQATSDAAGVDLTSKTAALDQQRRNVDALFDAYFQPGGSVPAPAPAPATPASN